MSPLYHSELQKKNNIQISLTEFFIGQSAYYEYLLMFFS